MKKEELTMKKPAATILTALALVVAGAAGATLAEAQSKDPVSVIQQKGNWQGPGYADDRSVFFERNKEVFDNGYYRYCTAANTNSWGSHGNATAFDLECTPIFSPEGVPVSGQ